VVPDPEEPLEVDEPELEPEAEEPALDPRVVPEPLELLVPEAAAPVPVPPLLVPSAVAPVPAVAGETAPEHAGAKGLAVRRAMVRATRCKCLFLIRIVALRVTEERGRKGGAERPRML
jgi:hypothetical protein